MDRVVREEAGHQTVFACDQGPFFSLWPASGELDRARLKGETSLNWSVEQNIRVGFGLALASLFVIGAISCRGAIRSDETFHEVDHTERVLDHLDKTLVGFLNV